MLYLYVGSDREKARTKMQQDAAKKKGVIVRITDANTLHDLKAALQGSGLFGEKQVILLESVYANEEMRDELLPALEKGIEEDVFMFEEKLLAADKRKLEKYVERMETFDAPKKERDGSIFAIANALKRADKKALWVSYMRELGKGAAPEAVHGVLFWSAKDALLKSGGKGVREKELVVALAELPHEARRRGEDLEYALERFVLSQ